jgi:hypothetical protein
MAVRAPTGAAATRVASSGIAGEEFPGGSIGLDRWRQAMGINEHGELTATAVLEVSGGGDGPGR